MEFFINYLSRSDISQMVKQFIYVQRLLSPVARRWLWTIYAMRLVSSLISTAMFTMFAVVLLIFNSIERVMENRYIAFVNRFLEIESQEWFLALIISIFVLFILFDRCFSIFSVWLQTRGNAFLDNEIVVALYGYYLVQDYHYHPERNHNEMMNKVGQVANAVVNKVLHPPVTVVNTLLNMAVMITGLLYLNPVITSAFIVGIFLYYTVLYQLLQSRWKRYGAIFYENNINISKLIREGLSAYTEIMFMGKEYEFVRHFRNYKKKNLKYQLRIAVINAIIDPMLRMVGMLFICVLGAYLVLSGDASDALPQIAVFAVAGLRVLPMASGLYTILQNMQSLKHSYEQVIPDMTAAMGWRDKKEVVERKPLPIKNELCLDNVSYTYPGQSTPAVDGVSLRVPAGSMVAMCGYSGSGKTTVARLVCGLLKPSSGSVLVDGKDIWSDLETRRSWHLSLGFLQRNPFFMNASIAENVAFELDKKKVDRERVQAAIEKACLKEFVEDLQHGMDTSVGENAVLLSSGQAQRLSIARAMYRDTSMLVLDESTSALDAITERAIMRNFQAMAHQKTVWIIAHQINLMRDADIIYVMDGGRVVTQGTHKELMATSELFRGLSGECVEGIGGQDSVAV